MGHKHYQNIRDITWNGLCALATGRDGEVVTVFLSLGVAGEVGDLIEIKRSTRRSLKRIIDLCWDDLVQARGLGRCAVLCGRPF